MSETPELLDSLIAGLYRGGKKPCKENQRRCLYLRKRLRKLSMR
jgi:hypothetical protein